MSRHEIVLLMLKNKDQLQCCRQKRTGRVAALPKNCLTYNFMVHTIEDRKDLENLPVAQIFYLSSWKPAGKLYLLYEKITAAVTCIDHAIVIL
jgi:hypothetical protein